MGCLTRSRDFPHPRVAPSVRLSFLWTLLWTFADYRRPHIVRYHYTRVSGPRRVLIHRLLHASRVAHGVSALGPFPPRFGVFDPARCGANLKIENKEIWSFEWEIFIIGLNCICQGIIGPGGRGKRFSLLRIARENPN